jgi:hypothetical protein
MLDPRDSGGALISKNIIIQGGWVPPSTNCDTPNQILTDTTDLFAAGFTFLAPLTRSTLTHEFGPVITIDPKVLTLTVQHMIFENTGITTTMGGGISGVISNGAKVRLENVVLTNSKTISKGGGLFSEVRGGAHLVISDSQFISNTSPSGGGFELLVSNNSPVKIYNTPVARNTAGTGKGGGGHIVLNNSNLTIHNSTFANNNGGGLYIEVRGGAHLVISNSQFISNTSPSGGGFEIQVFDNSRVTIHNTNISANTASTGNGGGSRIVINSGVVSITNSTFVGNKASTGKGGGLSIESSGNGPATVWLLNTNTFNNNSASSDNDLYLSGNGLTVFRQQIFLPLLLKNSSALSAQITNIILNGTAYSVAFQTSGFTPQLPGQHVHFFFNTVLPEQAGMPGTGPWKIYGGASPFTEYTVADRPAGATQMCILVANPDHSVQLGTGNCFVLP